MPDDYKDQNDAPRAGQRSWALRLRCLLGLCLLLSGGGCMRFLSPLLVRAAPLTVRTTPIQVKAAPLTVRTTPMRIDGSAEITAHVATTPRQEPVAARGLPYDPDRDSDATQARGRIAIVDVDGILLDQNATGLGARGENAVSLFRERLDAIEQDPTIRAVVLRIHSPGGSVTATDIMWRDLQAFRSRTNLPVVACLMDVAAGGAYYLATSSDLIVAHPTTVTGAIGCILNVYNLEDLMGQFNIVGVPVKAGKFVDMGSPVKAMDDESRAMLQEMADEFHERFKEVVLRSRPQVAADQESTFDGRVFTARKAVELGLVDRVGYLDDALAQARQLSDAPDASVVFFRRPDDPAVSPYSITPNVPLHDKLLPINVPGLNRARLPCFLYIWEMEPTLETSLGK